MSDDSSAALPTPPPIPTPPAVVTEAAASAAAASAAAAHAVRETIRRNARSVPGSTRFQARVMVAVVVVPFLAVLLGIALLWGRLVGWLDIALLVAFYVPVALGVTIGYHRMLTHQAFAAPAWIRGTFLALGSMSVEGGAIAWAIDHRTHHAHSDKQGDPHSPHLQEGEGVRALLAGLWHAHTGWLFDGTRMREVERYGKDLLQDRLIVFFQRTFILWVVAGIVLPGLVALAVTGGDPKAFLTGVLWGGLVRIFLTHHVTWSVNSICHVYGSRPFRCDDKATNNWLLALPTMGESWHHNHHVFPTSAYHGLTRRQLDISGAVIATLARLGLATDVRTPSADQVARRLERPELLRGGLRDRVRDRA